MEINVRRAVPADVASIIALSQRVQDALTAVGSLQAFGPLPENKVASAVTAGFVWVLDEGGKIMGGVFVEPLTAAIVTDYMSWGLDQSRSLWYLSKLMIAPEKRGANLSGLLLDEAKCIVAAQNNGLLVLDCWAGNTKLRSLYSNAGFALQGIFSEEDYEIAVYKWSG